MSFYGLLVKCIENGITANGIWLCYSQFSILYAICFFVVFYDKMTENADNALQNGCKGMLFLADECV